MVLLRGGLIATLLLGLATFVAADAPEDLPRLNPYLRSTPPVLQFSIVNGRLTLKCRPLHNFQTRSDYGDGRGENMTLGSIQGRSLLKYERTSSREQVKIEMEAAGGKAIISRTPRGKSSFAAMQFEHASGGKVKLMLGVGDRRREFQADTLWRLAIVQQKECNEHLLPLLDLLHPNEKLEGMVGRIEKSLLGHANEDVAVAEARWAALVKQLGDDQFSKREAADRALRAGGVSATAYLRHLDIEKLDAEQQFRIRRILRALTVQSDDDLPDDVAASLAKDSGVWLALLGRPDVATRRTAARQLAKLLDQPIDVDPAAEPDSQKEKREKLRARIEKK
jgi:hypothetical protein